MSKFLIFVLLFAALAPAQVPVPAQPRVYIDTTWRPPTGGTTWHPHSAIDFQTALNNSQPGDVIVLDAGKTYLGNFTIPVKNPASGKWIYIESSALASLPVPGTRIAPSNAANMPKITTPNTYPALVAQCVSPTGGQGYNQCMQGHPLYSVGTNHIRLVGLEITSSSTKGCNPGNNPPVPCWSYYAFAAESPDNGDNASVSPLADNITIDRCYIHGVTNGSRSQDIVHAVGANATNFAVIDSYISDIHGSTNDSQAVLAYYTPGPIKIVNNYLSATTEDVMLGGAGGYNNPYIPSDIEIRRNHFYKPMAWDQVGVTVPPYNMWVTKNNLDLKSGRRVILTGNVMENNWISGQMGFSVLFTVRTSQSGNIAVVDDVTFENNVLTNVDAGWSLIETDDQCGAAFGYPQCTNPGESKRIKINNNLLLMSPANDGSRHMAFSLGASQTDVVIQHNTVMVNNGSTCYASVYFNSLQSWTWPPQQSYTHDLWLLDNAFCRQPTGDWGGQGTQGLTYYMGDPAPLAPRFLGNVMYVPSGDRLQSFPVHNYASMVAFSYAAPGSGDYQLLSPYWTDTSDGKLSGINWSTLQAATSYGSPMPVKPPSGGGSTGGSGGSATGSTGSTTTVSATKTTASSAAAAPVTKKPAAAASSSAKAKLRIN